MHDKRTPFFWFPVLVPAYTAIFVASRNVGEFEAVEFGVLVLLLLAAGASVYAALHLLLRARRQPSNVALISALLSGWLFVGIAMADEIDQHLGVAAPDRANIALVVTGGLLALLVGFLLRRREDLVGPRRVAGVFVYVLIALASVGLANNALRASYEVSRSTFLRSRVALPANVQAQNASGTRSPRHDIYLVLLDKYANSDMLLERFHYSNDVFADSLRRLGFIAPSHAHSNYAFTWFSLASILNFEHVAGAGDSLGSAETLGLRFLIENNRSVAFLKRRGYRFYFFPSHMFVATRHDPRADVEFSESSARGRFRAMISRSQLAHTVWTVSVPGVIGRRFSFDIRHPEQEIETFKGLERVVRDPGPKFVFAHIMLTHEPFFFDGDCRLAGLVGRAEPDPQAYLQQIRCTNKLVLELVKSILKRSQVPPIILLQADHGTFPPDDPPGETAHPENRDARRAERYRAFGAYYLPGGGAATFDTAGTPVNLMRYVFTYYFGADLPPRANRSYWMGR